MDHWLQDSGYSAGNVLVFDLYNVLSSKTGGGASDVGLASGNHHRVWNGAVQHKTDDGADRLAYPSAGGDSHPNAAGAPEGDGRVRAAAQRRLQRLEGQRRRRRHRRAEDVRTARRDGTQGARERRCTTA